MKFSEQWLKEWVNYQLPAKELCEKLTMAGLEVESIAPVSELFSGVVIGEIIDVAAHPDASKLQICDVKINDNTFLKIVCGAKNARAGIKVPTALVGAVLPNNIQISNSKIRGISSTGMLCSAKELHLPEDQEGLLELPLDAPLGMTIQDYLQLNDNVIDISITPNRGDCLSLRGMAQEISALTETTFSMPTFINPQSMLDSELSIQVLAEADCPIYAGRIIEEINVKSTTPIWMQQRLRRAGLNTIHFVVDVMNYVMLELGQPMHAFDLKKINGSIIVRNSQKNEKIKLLNDMDVVLAPDTLIIADEKVPLAIAGVMGGLDSSVTLDTTAIFIESAYFNAQSIAKSCRTYHLNSDSAYRFERGIDCSIQELAIARASQLLIDFGGGKAGPISVQKSQANIPSSVNINLNKKTLDLLAGIVIDSTKVETIFKRLDFAYETLSNGWNITPPLARTDVKIDVDIVEEILRLYGYEKIPVDFPNIKIQLAKSYDVKLLEKKAQAVLCDLGYQEVITYSFIDKKSQNLFDPLLTPKQLSNPMSSEMSVMRTTLWPGLVNTLLYNQSRQQTRIKLFEIGSRFIPVEDNVLQQKVLSGILWGAAYPEQWAITTRKMDYYDLKGDIETLFAKSCLLTDISFKPTHHDALHPGQSAEIFNKDCAIGRMGVLHPEITQHLKIAGQVLVFEIVMNEFSTVQTPIAREVAKFPEIRRDIAFLIERSIPVSEILVVIQDAGGSLLKEVKVFDVYQGAKIEENLKSIALALRIQDMQKTMRDEEVVELIDRVIVALKDRFGVKLRS